MGGGDSTEEANLPFDRLVCLHVQRANKDIREDGGRYLASMSELNNPCLFLVDCFRLYLKNIKQEDK